MSQFKEMLENTYKAMLEEIATPTEENAVANVFIAESTEIISFETKLNTVLSVNTSLGFEEMPKAVMDMCLMAIGDDHVPEKLSEYLDRFNVDTDTLTAHVDEFVKMGVIPAEAAVYSFNELAGRYRGTVGPWPGVLLRHYPLIGTDIHPHNVAAQVFENIPERIRKNCAMDWENAQAELEKQFMNVQIFTKFIYASSVDQLNEAIVNMKNGAPHAEINFSHPAGSSIPGRTPKEQAIFGRSGAYEFLRGCSFWVDPIEKKLSLSVRLSAIEVKMLYHNALPMFTFLMSKVAEETNLTPSFVEFVVERIYMESSAETAALLSTLISETALTAHPIPDFVPSKPLVEFALEDLTGEKPNTLIV